MATRRHPDYGGILRTLATEVGPTPALVGALVDLGHALRRRGAVAELFTALSGLPNVNQVVDLLTWLAVPCWPTGYGTFCPTDLDWDAVTARAARRLLRLLESHPDAPVRRWALWSAYRGGPAGARRPDGVAGAARRELLERALRDPDPRVRGLMDQMLNDEVPDAPAARSLLWEALGRESEADLVIALSYRLWLSFADRTIDAAQEATLRRLIRQYRRRPPVRLRLLDLVGSLEGERGRRLALQIFRSGTRHIPVGRLRPEDSAPLEDDDIPRGGDLGVLFSALLPNLPLAVGVPVVWRALRHPDAEIRSAAAGYLLDTLKAGKQPPGDLVRLVDPRGRVSVLATGLVRTARSLARRTVAEPPSWASSALLLRDARYRALMYSFMERDAVMFLDLLYAMPPRCRSAALRHFLTHPREPLSPDRRAVLERALERLPVLATGIPAHRVAEFLSDPAPRIREAALLSMGSRGAGAAL